jgi:hypothetical protein
MLKVIRRDSQRPTVKEVIRRYSPQYSACPSTHLNDLLVNIMAQPAKNRGLRRHQIPSVTVVFTVLVCNV